MGTFYFFIRKQFHGIKASGFKSWPCNSRKCFKPGWGNCCTVFPLSLSSFISSQLYSSLPHKKERKNALKALFFKVNKHCSQPGLWMILNKWDIDSVLFNELRTTQNYINFVYGISDNSKIIAQGPEKQIQNACFMQTRRYHKILSFEKLKLENVPHLCSKNN